MEVCDDGIEGGGEDESSRGAMMILRVGERIRDGGIE